MRRATQAALGLSFLLLLLTAHAQSVLKVDRQVYLMGTLASLEIYSPDRDVGLDQLETLIEVLEASESELSTWQSRSELSLLNRHPVGSPTHLDADLCSLFTELTHWQEQTQRAFDPAIGALIDAWGLRESPRVPAPVELEGAMARSGMDHFRMDPGCIAVRQRDITFDAGGFGKGEALDRARMLAFEQEIDDWMVSLGGQIMVAGTPPDGEGWSIPLAHPARRDLPALYVLLAEGSIATSGGSERDMESDTRRLGHILDPRTGHPVSRNASVTVWHSRGLVADVLSTALYVMGVEEGFSWAEKNEIAACFLILEDEHVEVHATLRFQEQLLKP